MKNSMDDMGFSFLIWCIILLLVFFFIIRMMAILPAKLIVEPEKKSIYIIKKTEFTGRLPPFFIVLDYAINGQNQMPVTFFTEKEYYTYIEYLSKIGEIYPLKNANEGVFYGKD